MPSRDASIVELNTPSEDHAAAWERWLKAHLHNELADLHRALGQCLAEERQRFERKASALELKLAQITGAVDILRGAAPPPPAKFPAVKAWREDAIYHEGDVVAFAGGCFQATKDTARSPGSRDWVCLASPGDGFTVRGTYDVDETYKHLDVVMLNGSSFMAGRSQENKIGAPVPRTLH